MLESAVEWSVDSQDELIVKGPDGGIILRFEPGTNLLRKGKRDYLNALRRRFVASAMFMYDRRGSSRNASLLPV